MVNIRKTTPSSANASIRSASRAMASADGPTRTPTPRKPMIGLMRRNRESGTTTIAVTRNVSSSVRKGRPVS